MRPSTRNALPNGRSIGPSWTMRTSATPPMSAPFASTTRQRMRSLRRMPAPRDVVDDVIAHPTLGRVRSDLLDSQADLDRGAHVADRVEGNSSRIVVTDRRQTM